MKREQITMSNIREALMNQDSLTKRLPRKSRVNQALGWLSGLRDEQGRLLFRVRTDKNARIAANEMLSNKDFK